MSAIFDWLENVWTEFPGAVATAVVGGAATGLALLIHKARHPRRRRLIITRHEPSRGPLKIFIDFAPAYLFQTEIGAFTPADGDIFHDGPARRKWVEINGGIDALATRFTLILHARERLMIHNVQLVDLECDPPPKTGHVVIVDATGGYPIEELYVRFRPDTIPYLRELYVGDPPGPPKEVALPIAVSAETAVAAEIIVEPISLLCRWRLELTYEDDDGKLQKQFIDRDGQPFVTVPADPYPLSYSPDGHTFKEYGKN